MPAVRASLAVVPYYVRPSEAAIAAHFRTVAARSPVPLIVYNIPTARPAAWAARGALRPKNRSFVDVITFELVSPLAE